MPGGAFQFHGLVAESEVAHLRVVEGLAAVGAACDVIAFPEGDAYGSVAWCAEASATFLSADVVAGSPTLAG